MIFTALENISLLPRYKSINRITIDLYKESEFYVKLTKYTNRKIKNLIKYSFDIIIVQVFVIVLLNIKKMQKKKAYALYQKTMRSVSLYAMRLQCCSVTHSTIPYQSERPLAYCSFMRCGQA